MVHAWTGIYLLVLVFRLHELREIRDVLHSDCAEQSKFGAPEHAGAAHIGKVVRTGCGSDIREHLLVRIVRALGNLHAILLSPGLDDDVEEKFATLIRNAVDA